MAALACLAVIADALSLWVSLYVVAVFICTWQLAVGSAPPAAAALAAGAIAAATYLLDRAKLSDRRLDPSDPAAHPARAAFTRRHRRAIRIAILLLALLGAALAASIHPVAAGLAPAALLAVFLYAGRPPARGRPRLKDRLLLKNLTVGICLAGLGATLVWVAAATIEPVAAAVAFLFAAATVTADAILCDLDDAAADARYGTRTLPGAVGPRRTVQFALSLHAIVGAGLLACLPLLPEAAPPTVAVWAIGAPASAAAIVLARGRRPARTLIDARLPAIAALALLIV